VADFAGWVHKYNTERSHQGLAGMTPLTRWLADATPVRVIPKHELRWLLLAGERRIIGRDGIHVAGLTFIAPELHGRVGQQVEVRYMPHDLREIEVFKDAWLTTAKPQGGCSPRRSVTESSSGGARTPPSWPAGSGGPAARRGCAWPLSPSPSWRWKR
jgi:putative transposase